jgi:hypothetical protein
LFLFGQKSPGRFGIRIGIDFGRIPIAGAIPLIVENEKIETEIVEKLDRIEIADVPPFPWQKRTVAGAFGAGMYQAPRLASFEDFKFTFSKSSPILWGVCNTARLGL